MVNQKSVNLSNQQGKHKIAIFIDFPNLEISLRDNCFLQYPDISLIKEYANRFGKIEILKVYGDWNMLDRARMYLKKIKGIKLIHESHIYTGKGVRKDTVDMRMAFDIGACLEKTPGIDTYILVTGDADFLPVVRQVLIRGRDIKVVAEKSSLSKHLKNKCKITTYQELIRHRILNKELKSLHQLTTKKEEGVV